MSHVAISKVPWSTRLDSYGGQEGDDGASAAWLTDTPVWQPKGRTSGRDCKPLTEKDYIVGHKPGFDMHLVLSRCDHQELREVW